MSNTQSLLRRIQVELKKRKKQGRPVRILDVRVDGEYFVFIKPALYGQTEERRLTHPVAERFIIDLEQESLTAAKTLAARQAASNAAPGLD